MSRDTDRWGICQLDLFFARRHAGFSGSNRTGFFSDKMGFLREIREQVGTQRPAFVNGWVNCWVYGPDDLAHIYEQRDPDMVFVTPAQLATLYRQAKENGWVK